MASAAVGPEQQAESSDVRIARVLAYGAVLAVAGLIVANVVVNTSALESITVGLVVWSLLASLGAIATVELGPGRPTLSMDLPVLLACAYVEGPIAAGVVAMVGTFDQFELRGQSTPARLVWNHSQTALSVMSAGWVFSLSGGLDRGLPTAVFASGAALVTDAVVNYSCVALLQAIVSGDRFSRIVAAMKIGSTPTFIATYGCFGLLSLIVAVAYSEFGFAGVLVCVAPVVLAREAFAKSLHVEREASRVRAQSVALARVDERIADERHDERSQIAAALHDDVLQCLYNVGIRAQVIREDLRSGRLLELEEDVPALVEATDSAASQLRDVIHGLRRSPVGRGGLIDTVSLLADHLRDETGIKFVLELPQGVLASPDVELLAYQILREAMANAAKHSKADVVWVSVTTESGWLRLEVVDNGVGFDPELAPRRKHFGLPLMRERAMLGRGTLEIRSRPGEGAVIVASLPLSG